MCVVSMVGDHYNGKWQVGGSDDFLKRFEQGQKNAAEIMQLRKEVEELRELLKKAVEYDKRTNQPHCEDPKKIAFLIKAGDLVGVDLGGIFDGS